MKLATSILAALLSLPLLHAADPSCSKGILQNSRDGSACCLESCGTCGGPSCSTEPGGSAGCCGGTIITHADSCESYDPPCVFHTVKPPTQCGHYPEPLATDRPNVLLIGDSISMSVPFTPGAFAA